MWHTWVYFHRKAAHCSTSVIASVQNNLIFWIPHANKAFYFPQSFPLQQHQLFCSNQLCFYPISSPFFFRMDTFTDDFNFSMNSSIRLIKFENKSWKNTSENLLKHKMRTKSLENIFVSDAKKLADFDWHMESDDRLKGFVKTMKGQKKQCLPMNFNKLSTSQATTAFNCRLIYDLASIY